MTNLSIWRKKMTDQHYDEDSVPVEDRVLSDAKKFSMMFRGFLQAAEQWADISSLKQAADEAHARLHALKDEIEHLTKNRDKLKADMKAEVEAAMAADKAFYKQHVEHVLSRLDAVKKFGGVQ
jgi:hypothetical protein